MNKLPCWLLLAAVTLPAAAFDVTPKAGLWESNSKVLINGKDLLGDMQKMQQQMLANLPAEQRKAIAAMMPAQPDMSHHRECITKEEIARLNSPEQWLQHMKKEMPQCNFKVLSQTGNSVRVSGICEKGAEYNGDLEGTVTLVDATNLKTEFAGKGRYEKLPEMMQAQGPVQFQFSSHSHWVSAQCGNIK